FVFVPPFDADWNAVNPGSVSVRTTFVASWLPAFVTVMVYDRTSPGRAVMMPSDFVTRRSGAATTGVVSDPALSPGFGSGPFAPSSWAVAVLVSWATPAPTVGPTVRVTVRVTDAPAARFPIDQTTAPPDTAPPLLAEKNEVFAGSGSDKVTPVAS